MGNRSVAVASTSDHIGAATARCLAREGYHVFASDRNGEKPASSDARREDAITDYTHRPRRDAWTHEISLRTCQEPW
jgi:NAD(P)-dependent dehydrogenase (short-subunit alcohol dehydrogenase family)